MPCHASASTWNTGTHRCRPPGRALEIAAIILGFFFFWPAALLSHLEAHGISGSNRGEDVFREQFHPDVGELPPASAFLVDRQLRVRGISPPRNRAPRGRTPPPR